MRSRAPAVAGRPREPTVEVTSGRFVAFAGARSDTRDRILRAAIQMFGARDFESTTMRDLANAVGIKAPGIYNHFSSKEEILSAAIECTMRDFSRYVLGPDDAKAPPADRLRRIVMRHVNYQIADAHAAKAFDFFMYGSSQESCVSEYSRNQVRALLRQYVNVVSDILRLIDRRLTRRESRMRAIVITDMCDTVGRWYRCDGEYSPEKLGRFYWSLIRKIVDPA
jgi:TetR/AcrR family transcriptional regulator, cholesterol catabolism regulator